MPTLPRRCVQCFGDRMRGRSRAAEFHREVTEFVTLTMCMVGHEKGVAAYVKWLVEHTAAPSRVLDAADRPSVVTTAGADPASPSSDTGRSRLVSVVLGILPRCLLVFQAGVGAMWLAMNICIQADGDLVSLKDSLPALFVAVHDLQLLIASTVMALMQRLPDWRGRPVMLRVLARTATTAVLKHKVLAPKFINGQTPKAKATTQCDAQQLSLSDLLIATDMWKKLLALCGSEDPMVRALRAFAAPWVKDGGGSVLEEVMAQDGIVFYTAADEPAADSAQQPLPPPSSQQLSPVALDLVQGMDGMVEMMEKQQKMAQHMVDLRGGLRRFVGGYCGVLALCGHTIDVLGDPSVVGPADLAAQPASWLPCGNSLVEGWCTRLSAGICKLFCSPPLTRQASQSLSYTFNFLLCQGLADSHRLLFRGRQHPPPSMSHRAQRSISCLTMVLTAAVPLHGWLCIVHRLRVSGKKLKSHKTWCLEPMREALAQLEPELIWTWRALAASSSVESVLARILRDAALETQLSHLCAPPPKGWQASLGWSMQSSESLVPGLKLCLARLKQPVHS
ncbi:hypothetical protein HaLaN_26965 [Haematococcus lacustris]|uniref:Uncharacterized protein n=1 Tax=Haematococcus lacustris TaxID=44745 RepID=A0A6A0A8J3_HAELA|nr:hypothetical protein HaLaN_26965 [Haematococcus lacustris]